jgi:signal transduction histidine kinase
VSTSAPLLLRRLGPRQLLALDAVYAVAVGLLNGYAAIAVPLAPATGWHEPMGMSVAAGFALGAPTMVRRRWPLLATAAVLTAAALCLATGLIPDYAGPAPITAIGVVLYSVGTSVPGGRSVAAVVVCLAVTIAVLAYATDSPFGPGASEAAFTALILGACWGVGRTMRMRRAYTAREAEQSTARAVGEERLRITREMHDIVAHSLSLIAVKATIADHVADDRPQESRETLRAIATISRSALNDLRRTIGAVRSEAELAPAPGLAELPGLVAAATSAGIAVRLDVRAAADLPEVVALTVYRIVQEALTNVVKHANATRCHVEVAGGPGEVRIAVVDNGTPADDPPAPGGQGLIGIQERVALYDGDFHAGPHDTGGWAVRATLRYAP